MISHIHRTAAVFFYILAGMSFGAYLCLRNGLLPQAAGLWLDSVDLPLLGAGLLYGGTSLYLSLLHEEQASRTSLILAIAIPSVLLLAFFSIITFW